jgi:hypothetical protein
MGISTRLNREVFSGTILWLLLMLPLCFKIEFISGIILYPQDILVPFALIFYVIFSDFKVAYHRSAFPYTFLLLALILVVFSTLASFFHTVDIGGLLKVFKYIIYVAAIIVVSEVIKVSNYCKIISYFNRVAFLTISVTLILFIVGKIQSGSSWSDYFQQAMWEIEKMPTGFSNLVYRASTDSFVKYTGNHGIYGSYLVLVYLLNLGLLLDRNSTNTRFNIILLLLVLVNIGLLTSRETLLLFIVSNLGFLFVYLLSPKASPLIKMGLMISSAVLVVGVVIYGGNLTLIQKVVYTVNSFLSGNVESNVDLRFQVWKLTFSSFLDNPLFLFLGYGFNEARYASVLSQVYVSYNFTGGFASVPESFFISFLAYGGLVSLIFASLYFLTIALLGAGRVAFMPNLGKLLFFFTIGLIISNNTGASVLADLFMTQFGVIFVWFHKIYKYEELSKLAVDHR